jgi:hypothetical protein
MRRNNGWEVFMSHARRIQIAVLLAFSSGACADRNPAAPAPPQPGPDYSGTYTLTITASDAAGPCAPTFPQTAKRRVYAARIQQRLVSRSPYLEVYLSGADFIATHGPGVMFTGTVSSVGEIHFRIHEALPGDQWDFPSPAQVVERLSDGTQLVVAGDITARRAGATISGNGGAFIHSSAGRCAIDSFKMVFSGGSGAGDWDY